MVGGAWIALANDLQRELRQCDPSVRVHPMVDGWGLLRLEVISDVLDRRDARLVTRPWEKKAATMCERCGNPVNTVRVVGPTVVAILCPDCAPSER